MTGREAMFGMFGSGVVGFVLAVCFFGCSGDQLRPETVSTVASLTPCVFNGIEKGLKDDELVGHIAGCSIEALRVGIKTAEEARDAGTVRNKGK